MTTSPLLTITLAILLLSWLAPYINAELYDHLSKFEEKLIIPLSTANIDEVVQRNDFVFTLFEVTWCGHCRRISAEFSQLSKIMKEVNSPVIFGSLDVTENEELSFHYGIEAYPSLVLFVRGTPVNYTGNRDLESMQTWLQARVSSPSQELTQLSDLQRLIDHYKMLIVFFGDDTTRDFQVFTSVAQVTDMAVTFYHTKFKFLANKVFKGGDGKLGPRVIFFRNFDEGPVEFSKDALTTTALESFIQEYRVEKVIQFNTDHAVEQVFGKPGSSLVFLSDDSGDFSLYNIERIGLRFSQYLRIVNSTISTGMGRLLADYLDIPVGSDKQLWLINTTLDDVFKYKIYNSLTDNAIMDFIHRFLSTRLNKDNKIIMDEDILLDIDRAITIDFEKASKHYFVFHYRKSNCRVQSACGRNLESFRQLARSFYFISSLEFGLLDYDFSSQNPSLLRKNSVELPIVSYLDYRNKKNSFLPNFDYDHETLREILESQLQINTHIKHHIKLNSTTST